MGPDAGGKGGGPSQAVQAAMAQIAAIKSEREAATKLEADAAALAAAKSGGPSYSVSITVPEKRVGIVIGPKGATIKLIQDKTGVRIDTSGEEFTLTGSQDQVEEAEKAVRDLIDKGYTQLAYDDFQENYVMVYPQSFPELIGSKGAVVIALKEALKVEINFPDTKNTKPGRKCKVTLAGKKDAVEQAKE